MFRRIPECYVEIFHEMSNKCHDQSSAHSKIYNKKFYDSVLSFKDAQIRESGR